MKMKSMVKVASVVLTSGLALSACQKNLDSKSSQISQSAGLQHVTDIAALQSLITREDAFQTAITLAPSATISQSIAAGSCPPITTDAHAGIYPDTITVDWGTGCTSGGVTRSGKTIRVYTGDMANTGSEVTTSYDNFFVNGYQFEGLTKMAHNIRNKEPQNIYRLTYVDRKITQPGGDYVITNGFIRIVKQDTTSEYPGFPWGNFKTTGSTTNDELKAGNTYQYIDSIDDANPVIYNFCQFATKGVKIITFDNGDPSWTVDYGKVGKCDALADVTINGVTTTVTLPLNP